MVDICQISVRFFPSTCTRRIGKNCENNIKIKASSATLSQDRALFIYNLDKNKFTETSSTNPRNPNPQTGILTIQTVRLLGYILLPMVANPTNYPLFQRTALTRCGISSPIRGPASHFQPDTRPGIAGFSSARTAYQRVLRTMRNLSLDRS